MIHRQDRKHPRTPASKNATPKHTGEGNAARAFQAEGFRANGGQARQKWEQTQGKTARGHEQGGEGHKEEATRARTREAAGEEGGEEAGEGGESQGWCGWTQGKQGGEEHSRVGSDADNARACTSRRLHG